MANEQANQTPEVDVSTKQFEIPHTIQLTEPVQWGKDELPRTEITINRRLKAKDFKGIVAGDIKFDDMVKMLSKISGEPIAFIEELDAADMITAVEVINSFLSGGPKTGETA